MSSNAVTDDQPVESIKKFKFFTKVEKDEIEISIPEVSARFGLSKLLKQIWCWRSMHFVRRMRKTGSKTS